MEWTKDKWNEFCLENYGTVPLDIIDRDMYRKEYERIRDIKRRQNPEYMRIKRERERRRKARLKAEKLARLNQETP